MLARLRRRAAQAAGRIRQARRHIMHGQAAKLLVRQLKAEQQADGSFPGQFGAAASTSLTLLALALNYRFLPIYER